MFASIRPTRLRCDYRENPLGLEVERPRLFWQVESEQIGARQTAYQILVATTLSALAQNVGDLWDTERVESPQTVHIPYAGEPLRSLARAWWKVRVWDESGLASSWSAPAFWEAGLVRERDWSAEWIQDIAIGGPRTTAPCPYLRKEILIDAPVLRARLVVTALGLYEFRINGARVGDDHLTPGWTDYRERVQYQVYDVGSLLREGPNAVGAILGDGWYCGNLEWRGRQLYGDRPKLRAQLHVGLGKGRRMIFATDSSWRASFGPILESDLIMGESYDARRDLGAWDQPGYDDSAWRAVECVPVAVKCVGMRGPTVRSTQELLPIADPLELPRWPKPEYLFDLGQNMVGRVRLRVTGPAGSTVRLRFGEALDAEGKLYTANLRSARQTDYYTLRGDPEGEVWESRFTFHGFRYVEVSGVEGKPGRGLLTGIVMHSDTPSTGAFECSDDLVNQLQRNIDWGQRGNFVDVPTDCPQRDERLGWTGDAQAFVRTACFNRDVAGFFTKWQTDLRDAQSETGKIPPIAPNTGAVGDDGGPAWADAAVICPWTVYLCYGDEELLREHYDSLCAFVDRLERDAVGLIRSHPDKEGFRGFGDWLSTGEDTPVDLIGTAFFAYSARLLAKIARVLDRPHDEDRYIILSEQVRSAFQRRFVTSTGLVATNTQTANVLALHFDLLPPHARPRALQALVEDIELRGCHLSTGFVGTPYIAEVLSDGGRAEIAYKLLLQRTWPSWLYPVTQGATTIWERWDGWTEEKGFQDPGMNSFNHYAYGAIGNWLYSVVAGIELDEARPGYEHVILRPRPGGALRHARGRLESIRGPIGSSWRIIGGEFQWDVRIPANTTATAYVPCRPRTEVTPSPGPRYIRHLADTAQYELPSGVFTFRSRL